MDLNFKDPTPRTPEWWLQRLSKTLIDRNKRIDVFDNYYRGVHRLDFATPKFREAFGPTFAAFSDNWTKVVVDAVNERMSVTGFRYGRDAKSDDKAWKTWQTNNLDAMSQMGQLESLVNEESYGLVWPDDDGQPVITIEHPSECIVEFAAGSRTKRAAGLKQFVNDDGYIWATLFLPDGIYKFESVKKADKVSGQGQPITWQQREVDLEAWPLANPLGTEIPLVPLMNNPRLLTGGVSELDDIIPLQDAINKTITDLLVTSEFAAAPQRYAIGFDPPTDASGNVVAVFEKLVNRLWVSSRKDTQFGQFPQADMTPYVKVIEMFVTHFASRTRTPPHYFYLNGQFPSGDAVKAAETGLVAKARRKMIVWGESYEEIMRLSFVILGDKGRSQERAIETIWADPESRTEGEHIDATVKLRALGVPLATLWQRAGFTPTEIERFKDQLAEEATWKIPAAVDAGAADTQIANGTRPATAEQLAPDAELVSQQ